MRRTTERMSPALEKIRSAYLRCVGHAAAEPLGVFRAVDWTSLGHAEQTHHGTTEYALAAWFRMRDQFRGRLRLVCGIIDYLVPDMDGNRTIATPALVVERDDGQSLTLTGCSWGYGGEGPHGSAAILADLGLFKDFDAALAFVAALPGREPWSKVAGPKRGRPSRA